MIEADKNRLAHRWYTRPVFFVANVSHAIQFHVEMLGFEKTWHSGAGNGSVCQVHRGECEIFLREDAKRKDRGRLFIELTATGLAELRREFADRTVPFSQLPSKRSLPLRH